MMRNYAQRTLDQECPFYRPSPFTKTNQYYFQNNSKLYKPHNFTLPLQSSIQDLKMNNPFRNNISISTISNNSKFVKSPSYCSQIEQIHSLWKKTQNIVYDTAPHKIQQSIVKVQKQSYLENKRVSLRLQQLASKQQQSKIMFKESNSETETLKQRKILQKRDSNILHSSIKHNEPVSFKKSLMKFSNNQEQIYSKTVIEQPEQTIIVGYDKYYSTKVKKRRLNF